MKYLQKVIVWIDSEKYAEELVELANTLREDGIALESIKKASAQWNDAEQGNENRESIQRSETDPDSAKLQSPTLASRLWLTDNSPRAAALQQEGEAVLALLHEDNRGQDFSGISFACEHPGELDADFMERVYRRLAGLPWDVAETDRCIIRETTEADVEEFFQIYSNPEVTRYTESLYPTIEQEKQYVREYIEKIYGFYGFGVWTVLKKDTGEVIGRAGFSFRAGYEEPELGFVIGVPWQRQGFAEEVCRALLQYAGEELGFLCVQAFVLPENGASVRLCEKLGFHKTGLEELEGVLYERFYKNIVN